MKILYFIPGNNSRLFLGIYKNSKRNDGFDFSEPCHKKLNKIHHIIDFLEQFDIVDFYSSNDKIIRNY